MNRPTIEVDDLLDMADEAIAEGDFTQAVTILRKAVAVAPLRKDIRNRMAIALEGAPVNRNTPSGDATKPLPGDAHGLAFSLNAADGDIFDSLEEGVGRDAISAIAKKAFEAAADQTARASVATRNLTNLLHQGLQTWKSSLAHPVKPLDITSLHVIETEPGLHVSDATQAGVFAPEIDFADYLRTNAYENGRVPAEDFEDNLDEELIETPPASDRKKNPRILIKKKNAPQKNDVEDVLAAGIDGFITVCARADKRKFVFGIVYTALGALFSYACFDVSKKFPAVSTSADRPVQAASMGNLNLSEVTDTEAIHHARKLAVDGKSTEAIIALKAQLESGNLLKSRDQIRIELATILNTDAEKHLTNNQLGDSVYTYREALKILPGDAALQLRLANALYYLGTSGGTDAAAKKTALTDAEKILKVLSVKSAKNLQMHRLLALVNEALGKTSQAKASWQKVKALALSESAEMKEAASHLK